MAALANMTQIVTADQFNGVVKAIELTNAVSFTFNKACKPNALSPTSFSITRGV